jgi:hypothetical protein
MSPARHMPETPVIVAHGRRSIGMNVFVTQGDGEPGSSPPLAITTT